VALHQAIQRLLLLAARGWNPFRTDATPPTAGAVGCPWSRLSSLSTGGLTGSSAFRASYRSGFWAIYLLPQSPVLCAVLPLRWMDSPQHAFHSHAAWLSARCSSLVSEHDLLAGTSA